MFLFSFSLGNLTFKGHSVLSPDGCSPRPFLPLPHSFPWLFRYLEKTSLGMRILGHETSLMWVGRWSQGTSSTPCLACGGSLAGDPMPKPQLLLLVWPQRGPVMDLSGLATAKLIVKSLLEAQPGFSEPSGPCGEPAFPWVLCCHSPCSDPFREVVMGVVRVRASPRPCTFIGI